MILLFRMIWKYERICPTDIVPYDSVNTTNEKWPIRILENGREFQRVGYKQEIQKNSHSPNKSKKSVNDETIQSTCTERLV